MPEGPEVRRVVDVLRESILGKLCLHIEYQPELKTYSELHPAWERNKHLFPATCIAVICVGKQIFIFFDNNLALNSGLGMTGHWLVYKPENYHTWNPYQQAHHIHASLSFGQCFPKENYNIHLEELAVVYDDSRRMGNLTLKSHEEMYTKIQTLRNDLMCVHHPLPDVDYRIRLPISFNQSISYEEFYAMLQNVRRSQVDISTWLMDQKSVMGVGNYIKCESLYLARINPQRPISQINKEESQRLLDSILWVMHESYINHGMTHGNFVDPFGEPGTYHAMVYQRDKCPNGFTVEKFTTKDSRSTYYVPNIQL